jgi:hypothetical protein
MEGDFWNGKLLLEIPFYVKVKEFTAIEEDSKNHEK